MDLWSFEIGQIGFVGEGGRLVADDGEETQNIWRCEAMSERSTPIRPPPERGRSRSPVNTDRKRTRKKSDFFTKSDFWFQHVQGALPYCARRLQRRADTAYRAYPTVPSSTIGPVGDGLPPAGSMLSPTAV
ncbi:MAG: hypothetical protein WBO46_25490 [Caldilineaceae bacterium]